MVIIDPSAASFKTELIRRGMWIADADNEVSEGIRVTSMLLNQKLIRFCRETTPRTVQEMQSYAWDRKAAERGEEKPLKDSRPRARRFAIFREKPSSFLEIGWWVDPSVELIHPDGDSPIAIFILGSWVSRRVSLAGRSVTCALVWPIHDLSFDSRPRVVKNHSESRSRCIDW